MVAQDNFYKGMKHADSKQTTPYDRVAMIREFCNIYRKSYSSQGKQPLKWSRMRGRKTLSGLVYQFVQWYGANSCITISITILSYSARKLHFILSSLPSSNFSKGMVFLCRPHFEGYTAKKPAQSLWAHILEGIAQDKIHPTSLFPEVHTFMTT